MRGNSSYHGPATASLTTPPSPLTGASGSRGPSSRRSFPGIEQASSSFSEQPILSHRSSGSDTNLKQRGSSAALMALQSCSSHSGGSLHSHASNPQGGAPFTPAGSPDAARAPMQIHDAEP